MTDRSIGAGIGAAVLLFGAALAPGAAGSGPSDAAGTAPAAATTSMGAAPTSPGQPVRAQAGNPLWSISLSELKSTGDRPLFSVSRRPPPPVIAAPVYTAASDSKPVEPDRPQWSLIGTVVSGSEGIGVFLDQSTNQILKLKLGEGHSGWTLRKVSPRNASLENSSVTVVLVIPGPNDKPGQNIREAAASSPNLMGRHLGSGD
jgi:hypothetical protein